jgi:hypothetical protein
MFNFSPITMTRMIMDTNDMVIQNMLLLIDNVMQHMTCMKPKGKIFNKCAKCFFASTHGAPTLVDFCTKV